MKGYTYGQETARQVGLEAMQNGITGGSGNGSNGGGIGGGLGELAGLGVTLGAMGGVINMTRDALNPLMEQSAQVGAGFGNVVQGNAASGAAQGAPMQNTAGMAGADGWVCPSCGKTGITTNFCPDCGTSKVNAVNSAAGSAAGESWDCTCGAKGITSRFCPDCGRKRGE